MLAGLAFLAGYAPAGACWSECGADVVYMFFHLATRSRQGEFTRRARSLARRSAARWLDGHARVPARASAEDVLWGYAYGAYTATRVGLDTRGLLRDLAATARSLSPQQVFGFHPKRQAPPSAEAWQCAMVGSHIAEGVGMRLGCSIRDAARWRRAMQPYPTARRGMGWSRWSMFYAVTHLVYVLNDYNLHLLPGERFAPEVAFLRAACEVAIAEDDVEALGESLDALLALGASDGDPRLELARRRLVSLQNRDGSWGRASDEPYTRMHKTWVALDGLTPYGRRSVLRPRLRATGVDA